MGECLSVVMGWVCWVTALFQLCHQYGALCHRAKITAAGSERGWLGLCAIRF